MDELPSELLAIIFSLVVSSPLSPLRKDTPQAFYKDLLAITHVCNHWCSVAHQTPSLWTTVKSPEYLPAGFRTKFLHCSGTLPLHVSLSMEFDSMFTRTLFQDHASRISTLEAVIPKCVRDGADNYTLPYTQDFSWLAPQLRELRLSYTERDANGMPLYHGTRQLLFSDNVPRLSKLEISRIPWLPANRFDTLVSMVIQSPITHGPDFVKDLFAMLSRAPQLKELYLTAAAHDDDISPSDLPGVVSLPRLRKLQLGFPFTSTVVVDLLSCIHLPDDHITLCLADIFWEVDPLAYFEALPQWNFTHSLISLHPSNVHQTRLIATGPSCGLQVQFDDSIPLPFELLHVLRTSHNGIKELWLDESLDINGLEDLIDILAQLPLLETIVIAKTEAESGHWLPALANILRGTLGAASGPSLRCPNLTTLRLWLPSLPVPADLVALAVERAQGGRPLKNFLVESPAVREQADMELMRDLRRSVEMVSRRVGPQPTMHLPEMCARTDDSGEPCLWNPCHTYYRT